MRRQPRFFRSYATPTPWSALFKSTKGLSMSFCEVIIARRKLPEVVCCYIDEKVVELLLSAGDKVLARLVGRLPIGRRLPTCPHANCRLSSRTGPTARY